MYLKQIFDAIYNDILKQIGNICNKCAAAKQLHALEENFDAIYNFVLNQFGKYVTNVLLHALEKNRLAGLTGYFKFFNLGYRKNKLTSGKLKSLIPNVNENLHCIASSGAGCFNPNLQVHRSL
jgi:F0F1-type ATP synthase delta subunit